MNHGFYNLAAKSFRHQQTVPVFAVCVQSVSKMSYSVKSRTVGFPSRLFVLPDEL